MHDPTSTKQTATSPGSKPRGANRSTKVAGKLKVLPEQPEISKPTKSGDLEGESAIESEDGDIESSDELGQEDDVEVSCESGFFEQNDL
jgi:hypothetical protein